MSDLDASLAAAREEYTRGGLTEDDLLDDPFEMFGRWYDDARTDGIHEPNAMVVATASAEGRPSARFVLLKGIRADGFVFFTNLASQKGRDLADNPWAALLFPWHPVERQVRVEGPVSLLPRADVDDYFAQRPRGSRLGAWASHQSTAVTGRGELAAAYDEAEARFDGREVPAPDEWGGYLVRPDSFEFWQGRPGRMHDRLVYTRTPAGPGEWAVGRLAP